MLLVLSGLALAVGVGAHNSLISGQHALQDMQAYYIAEGGWQRARQALAAGTWSAAASPGNTYTETFGAGEYRVTVVDVGNGNYQITSNGYVPNQTATVAKRQVIEYQISVSTSDSDNYSATATASASSVNGSYTAANANDGDNATYWRANNNGNGEWLKMDYGASPPTVNRIVILENANIDGVTLQWSTDNSTWTTPSGLSIVESPSQTWTATFTAGARRYIRATFTASGSGVKVAVNEMETYYTTINSLGQGQATTQW